MFGELNGARAATVLSLIHGAGVGYFNGSLTAMRNAASADPWGDAIASAIHGGATRGGFQFTAKDESRVINLDGFREVVKGSKRKTHTVATMSVSIGEQLKANIQKHFLSTSATDLTNGYDEITGTDSDVPTYIDSFWLATTYGEQALPCVFVLKNCLSQDGFSISTQDLETAVSQLNLMGHYDLSSAEKAPYSIFVPQQA